MAVAGVGLSGCPMNGGRWLLRLYPRDWRQRYGQDIEELIDEIANEHGRLPFRFRVDLLQAALYERGQGVLKAFRSHRRAALRVGSVIAALALGANIGVFAFGSSAPKLAQSPPIAASTLNPSGPMVAQAEAYARAAAAAAEARMLALQVQEAQRSRLLEAEAVAQAQAAAAQARALAQHANAPNQ